MVRQTVPNGFYPISEDDGVLVTKIAFISCQLDYSIIIRCSIRFAGHCSAQVAVCVERHCTTDHWNSTSWSYHAGTTRTPLAIHPRACEVRSGMSNWRVAVRAGASLFALRPTALGALCGQLTFGLAWCRQHLAVTATELLQPLDLACGTLFRSSYAIQTSPLDCSDDRRDTFREAWTWHFVTSDMRRLRQHLLTNLVIHLLTYLLTYSKMVITPFDPPYPETPCCTQTLRLYVLRSEVIADRSFTSQE